MFLFRASFVSFFQAPSIAVIGAGFDYPDRSQTLAGKEKGKAGQEPLFSSLKFNITTHSRVALAGKNGSGKSTLLRLLAGRCNLIFIDSRLRIWSRMY